MLIISTCAEAKLVGEKYQNCFFFPPQVCYVNTTKKALDIREIKEKWSALSKVRPLGRSNSAWPYLIGIRLIVNVAMNAIYTFSTIFFCFIILKHVHFMETKQRHALFCRVQLRWAQLARKDTQFRTICVQRQKKYGQHITGHQSSRWAAPTAAAPSQTYLRIPKYSQRGRDEEMLQKEEEE